MHRNYSPLDIDFNIDDVSVRALLLKFTDDALKAKAQGPYNSHETKDSYNNQYWA